MAVEQHTVGMVLQRLTAGLSDEEFEDVLTRWTILYDVYYPPKREARHGA